MFSETLLAQATSLLRSFYEKASTLPPFPLENLAEKLKSLGAADDEDLRRNLYWEDIETLGIPRIQARKLAELFRGKEPAPAAGNQSVMVVQTEEGMAMRMPTVELVTAFAQNPALQFTPIAEQIRARSGNQPCIALDDEGKIDVVVTAKVLDGLAQGDVYNGIFRSGGKVFDLYRVADAHNPIRDEHPVLSDEVLNSDGSDSFGIMWGPVPLNCRQLLQIAVEVSEIVIAEDSSLRSQLVELRERASRGFELLAEIYPNAHREFRSKKSLNALSQMKTRVHIPSAAPATV